MKRTTMRDHRETGSSVIFSATSGDKIRHTEVADTGADASIMDKEMLTKLQKADVHLQIEKLMTPRIFKPAANEPGNDNNISCN